MRGGLRASHCARYAHIRPTCKWSFVAPVAQGIEHRSPKAGVVRSNRTGGTRHSTGQGHRVPGLFAYLAQRRVEPSRRWDVELSRRRGVKLSRRKEASSFSAGGASYCPDAKRSARRSLRTSGAVLSSYVFEPSCCSGWNRSSCWCSGSQIRFRRWWHSRRCCRHYHRSKASDPSR